MKYVPDGIITTYHVIDREYNEKVKTRGWRPEKLIDKHHKSFKSGLKDILRGDDQPYTIVDDDRIHKIWTGKIHTTICAYKQLGD